MIGCSWSPFASGLAGGRELLGAATPAAERVRWTSRAVLAAYRQGPLAPERTNPVPEARGGQADAARPCRRRGSGREPTADTRHDLEPTDVGRDGAGLVLADPHVSRRHLQLVPDSEGLTVRDLGSTNGTTLNGTCLSGEARMHRGDVLSFGDSEITLAEDENLVPGSPASANLDRLASIDGDAVVVRYAPGTAGERCAVTVAAAGAPRPPPPRRARVGAMGRRAQICLVDPFPDPDRPGEMVSDGSFVDPIEERDLDGRDRGVPT